MEKIIDADPDDMAKTVCKHCGASIVPSKTSEWSERKAAFSEKQIGRDKTMVTEKIYQTKECKMNEDFNKRAEELFGKQVGEMLRAGNTSAGRWMDDNSNLLSALKLSQLSDEEIVSVVRNTAEKRFLYGIYCAKFVNHPSNRDPSGYDNYRYGDSCYK